MGILAFIILAVVLGVIVWLVWKTPIHAAFKQLILWAAIGVLILVLLNAFGIVGKTFRSRKFTDV